MNVRRETSSATHYGCTVYSAICIGCKNETDDTVNCVFSSHLIIDDKTPLDAVDGKHGNALLFLLHAQ